MNEFAHQLESAVRPGARVEILRNALRQAVDDPLKCAELAGLTVDVGLARKEAMVIREGRLQRALANIRLERTDAALEDLKDLASYAAGGRNDGELAGFLYLIGELKGRRGEVKAAMEDLERARACALSAGRPGLVRACLYAMGRMFGRQGMFEEALRLLLDAVNTGADDGRVHDLGDIHFAIGEVHTALGQHERAIRSLDRSIEAYREAANHSGESSALAAIAQVESAVGNDETALRSAERALCALSSLGMSGTAANSMLLLAAAYEKLGDLQTATMLLEQVLSQKEMDPEGPLQVRAVTALARVYSRSSHGYAQLAVNEALKLAEKLNDPGLLIEIHQLRSTICEDLKLYAQALDSLKRFSRLKEQVAGEEMQKKIAELQQKFDYEMALREAKRLEAAVIEKERALQERIADLLAKTELINDVASKLRGLADVGSGDGKVLGGLVRRLEAAQSTDRTWHFVRDSVETIHPGFTQRLLERCPTLTPTEIDICTLLRLRLSIKEIASSRGGSTRTVEKHIQNIREKMELEPDVKLWHFLAAL